VALDVSVLGEIPDDWNPHLPSPWRSWSVEGDSLLFDAPPAPSPPPPTITLRVVANDAPLESLALALSEATRLNVAVSSELVGQRVTLALPRTTFGDLLFALNLQMEVVLTHQRGVVYFETRRQALMRRVELAPLVTVVLPMPEGVSAVQFAATWCHSLARSREKASVIGQRVILMGTEERIAQARALVDALEAP